MINLTEVIIEQHTHNRVLSEQPEQYSRSKMPGPEAI